MSLNVTSRDTKGWVSQKAMFSATYFLNGLFVNWLREPKMYSVSSIQVRLRDCEILSHQSAASFGINGSGSFSLLFTVRFDSYVIFSVISCLL